MKKILLILACMFGMSITASAEQYPEVMLQHGSSITTYQPEQINDAIAAAVDGDEIYLTNGDFPGFTVDKEISIKGTGMQTVIKGEVIIENKERTLNNLFLGYIDFYYVYPQTSISVNSPVKGLKISQSRIEGGINFNAITEESYIDRCMIYSNNYGLNIKGTYTQNVTIDGKTSSYGRSYIQGLTVTNSHIVRIDGNPNIYQDVAFVNCYLYAYRTDISLCGAKIVNSILRTNHGIGLHKCEVINSSYAKVNLMDDSTLTDCYDVDIEDYESEDVKTNGYLGNDGTVIGPMGGNTPYTLEPTLPKVTKADMKVDPKAKKLNVTLTVSPK